MFPGMVGIDRLGGRYVHFRLKDLSRLWKKDLSWFEPVLKLYFV